MERVLLDTSCYLAYLKGEWYAASVKKIFDAVYSGEILLCYTSVTRMQVGKKFRQSLKGFDAIIANLGTCGSFERIEPEKETVLLTKKLQKRTVGLDGRAIGWVDNLFLALAKRYGCTLIAADTALVRNAEEEGIRAIHPADFARALY